jgi:hypothetical protein
MNFGGSFQGREVKRPEHENDHSPLSRLKMLGINISTLPNVSMAQGQYYF